MVALELLKNMKQNMEGVNTISVPYHISQIKKGIVEILALQADNARLREALKWWIKVNEGAPNKYEWAEQALNK